jgi:hypothetical protein
MEKKTSHAHQLGNQARHCVRVANHRCAIGYYKTGRLTHGTAAEATKKKGNDFFFFKFELRFLAMLTRLPSRLFSRRQRRDLFLVIN